MDAQIKYAQQEIMKAGKELSSAKMRLDGTRYEADAQRAWDALQTLNDRLVKDLRK